MNKSLMLILMCMMIVFSPIIGVSQETETDYSYGTVVEVKKDSKEIVISEYDWDGETEIQVTYAVHPDIDIEDIDSWENIPIGSYADIEYIIDENGKKSITYMSIYESEPGEVE